MSSAQSDDLHIRIPRKLKRAAQKVIEANGMDVSGVVRLFFTHISLRGTIPLTFISMDNGLPREFGEELLALSKDRKNIVGPFASKKALLKSLYAED